FGEKLEKDKVLENFSVNKEVLEGILTGDEDYYLFEVHGKKLFCEHGLINIIAIHKNTKFFDYKREFFDKKSSKSQPCLLRLEYTSSDTDRRIFLSFLNGLLILTSDSYTIDLVLANGRIEFQLSDKADFNDLYDEPFIEVEGEVVNNDSFTIPPLQKIILATTQEKFQRYRKILETKKRGDRVIIEDIDNTKISFQTSEGGIYTQLEIDTCCGEDDISLSSNDRKKSVPVSNESTGKELTTPHPSSSIIIRKIQLVCGQAKPAAVVSLNFKKGPAAFCKEFNEKTKNRNGELVRVKVTFHGDDTYDYDIGSPPSTYLIKKALGEKKEINQEELKRISQQIITNLNTDDLERAMKIVAGTVRNKYIDNIMVNSLGTNFSAAEGDRGIRDILFYSDKRRFDAQCEEVELKNKITKDITYDQLQKDNKRKNILGNIELYQKISVLEDEFEKEQNPEIRQRRLALLAKLEEAFEIEVGKKKESLSEQEKPKLTDKEEKEK
ncbi:17452_t:CDS:2, partial [Racocetra fulgida]